MTKFNDLNDKELIEYPESVLRLWFIENFKKLGYEQIVGGSLEAWQRSVPDFIMLKNNKKIKVELERKSSHFFLHKHTPEQVDEVICFVKDKHLPVKVIEIKEFVNKEILDKYSERWIYQQKCNELLSYDDNWTLIKDLIESKTPHVYEYLGGLSQTNPKKFLEVYEQYCKRKMKRVRKDYETHRPFDLNAKYCLNCGLELPKNAGFCSECGAKQS